MKYILMLALAASAAFATTTIRDQDVPSMLRIGGLQIQGAHSLAEIQVLSCADGAGACMVSCTDEGDLYLSTGTAAGQYRNARTGKGPY